MASVDVRRSPPAGSLALVFSLVFFLSAASAASTRDPLRSAETKLQALLDANLTGPSVNVPPSEPTVVKIGLHFNDLQDVDVVAGTVTLSIWRRLSWKDPRVSWDASAGSEFQNTTFVVRDPNAMWTPDALLYNSVGLCGLNSTDPPPPRLIGWNM